jgi:hypothetical protein
METHRSHLLLATLFLLCSSGAFADSAPLPSVDVGGRKIVVPFPEDNLRSDGVNTTWDTANAALLPPTNRLLMSFASKEDVELLKKGEAVQPRRGFNIQVTRNVESREIGDKTFAEVRGDARAGIEKVRSNLDAEIKKLVASGNTKLSGQFGADAALSISDTAVLGFFDESPSALGFTMAMKVGAKSDGDSAASRMVTAAMMTPVNGRLLNLYAHSDYTSEADRQWVEKAVTTWRDALRAANPKVQGPSAGGFDFGSVLRSAAIGGVVGAVAGLVAWLFKRKRRAA